MSRDRGEESAAGAKLGAAHAGHAGAHNGHAGAHTGHADLFRSRFWITPLPAIPVILYSRTVQH